jgi:hypothetical protein
MESEKNILIKDFIIETITIFKYFDENFVYEKNNSFLIYFNEWNNFKCECKKELVEFNEYFVYKFIFHRILFFGYYCDLYEGKNHSYYKISKCGFDVYDYVFPLGDDDLQDENNFPFIKQIVKEYFEELNCNYVLK